MYNQFRNRNVEEEILICRCRRVNIREERRRRRRRNENNPYSHDYWDNIFDF